MNKHIEELKIGDVLSENVVNVNMSTIAKKGDSITERILNILKMWGIKEINIKSVKPKKSKKNKNNTDIDSETIIPVNKIMETILSTSKKIISDRIDFFENE